MFFLGNLKHLSFQKIRWPLRDGDFIFWLEEMGLNLDSVSNARVLRGMHVLCLERYHDTIHDTQTPSVFKTEGVGLYLYGWYFPSDGPSNIEEIKGVSQDAPLVTTLQVSKPASEAH